MRTRIDNELTLIEIHDQGSLRERYEIYRTFADDGAGQDITTGEPIKSFEEWLDS
jgi:hypothetical protein